MDGRIHFGKFTMCAGGVGRNITEALTKLNCPPSAFLSVLGNDEQGKILRNMIPQENQKQIKVIENQTTAFCVSAFDSAGDCSFLFGDMDIHQQITPEMIRAYETIISKSPLIVIDGNLSIPTIDEILKIAQTYNIPVFFEPTDLEISIKPFKTNHWKAIKFITPNLNELHHIAKFLKIPIKNTSSTTKIEEAANIVTSLIDYVDNILVTLGPNGLLVARKGDATQNFLTNPNTSISIRHYKVEKLELLTNVSGAGDSLASGIIAGILENLSEENCVAIGFEVAKRALYSSSTVANVLFDKNDNIWKSKASYTSI